MKMANAPQGLITSLNAIREMSVQNGTAYHQYIPVLTSTSDISVLQSAVLNTPVVMNEFVSQLVNRIIYTQFENKYFNNPLRILEGDSIPLGYAGQEIYVNPAKARKFNIDDFAGLLVKYEADVKVQYTQVNSDLQYPVTITRSKLKQAFVSWDALERFIGEISQSLYNGAYINDYNFTKGLVTSAYSTNQVKVEVVSAPTTEALAKTFSVTARTLFLNMQAPSNAYNAWEQVGGYGRPVMTWTEPSNIVFLIRNDVLAYIDVMSLANAFNIDRASLMGQIIPVNNFDVYNDDGTKKLDGSNIIGMIADRTWFRIKEQDRFLDEFYNPNNRTWQYYLNVTKMFNYSLFSNAIVLATQAPSVNITSMSFDSTTLTATEGDDPIEVHVTTNPYPANQTITYTSSASGVATVAAKTGDNKTAVITIVGDGTATITATAGNVTATTSLTVEAGS